MRGGASFLARSAWPGTHTHSRACQRARQSHGLRQCGTGCCTSSRHPRGTLNMRTGFGGWWRQPRRPAWWQSTRWGRTEVFPAPHSLALLVMRGSRQPLQSRHPTTQLVFGQSRDHSYIVAFCSCKGEEKKKIQLKTPETIE